MGIAKILILIISLFFISSRFVYADTQADIIKRLDSDVAAANNFLTQIESTEDPAILLAIINREAPLLRNHFDESSTFYTQIYNSESDENLQKILDKLINTAKGIAQSLSALEQAIEDGDETAFTNSLNTYDWHIEQLNVVIQDINSHYGVFDYTPWLALSFWFSLVVSGFLFIISRGNPILPAERLRNQFEFALFKSSLWPFGGSTISYFWSLLTPVGETYYVFWWPILIGYFQFFRGLYSYIRYSRPAINIAKQQEQEKLEALLTSEHFQKESLKEKAAEIGNLSPVIKVGK